TVTGVRTCALPICHVLSEGIPAPGPVIPNAAAASDEPRARDRNDEASPSTPVLLLLRQDLVRKVPCEQEHFGGHRFEEVLRGHDRQPHPWHEEPLLVLAPVRDEVQQVRTDP